MEGFTLRHTRAQSAACQANERRQNLMPISCYTLVPAASKMLENVQASFIVSGFLFIRCFYINADAVCNLWKAHVYKRPKQDPAGSGRSYRSSIDEDR